MYSNTQRILNGSVLLVIAFFSVLTQYDSIHHSKLIWPDNIQEQHDDEMLLEDTKMLYINEV